MYSIVLLTFLLGNTLFVVCEKCQIYVDITDGVQEGTTINKDGVTYTVDNYFKTGDNIKGCICNVKPCVRKCCAENESMNLTTRKCVPTIDPGSGLIPGFVVFNIIHVPENRICDDSEVKIRINSDFQVVDGVLVWEDFRFSMNNYCLAVTPTNQMYAIACVVNEESKMDSIVSSLGMLISMPFLLATFLVYLILPDSSIHKKALMFYVLTLLLAYICLVTVQLRRSDSSPLADIPCQLIGYSIVFMFTVSFCWLNVMCIDMWLAFSGLARFAASKTAETKRFLYYSAYAWGTPLILISIIYFMNSSPNTKTIYHPQLGIGRCFLEDGYPSLFYFHLPMAILIGINIILFILTAFRIQQVKRETSVLKQNDSRRHAYQDDQQKFNLYLKLTLAMGVNWSMEFISWLVNWQMDPFPTAVWYLTDFANAAYGVFIFFLFVFKRKIWVQLQKRYYTWIGKPHLAQALSTVTTRTSGFSSSDSHVQHSDIRMNQLRNGNTEERPLRGN